MLPRALAILSVSVWTFAVSTANSYGAHDALPAEALTPGEQLDTFRFEPGFHIELVAAEPLVESPVAMAFDERGRLFVAENRGYPTGPPEGEPPLGRIALLEDSDGDGRLDHRTTFADKLTFPNGVLPWKDGLIVTCAPEILYLRDRDRDGRSDEREVWFTGFSTSGSTQLRVSHPTLAPDGWIYVTSGLSGGKVTRPAMPDRPPIELQRSDFRFRPDLSAWEAADGGSQFGLTFDDFGRRFICYNRVQVQHVVIPARVLRRNPHLAFSETVQNCPAEMLAAPSRGHGAAARLFPISSNVTTADSHAGTFTAACAVTVFRGSTLTAPFDGAVLSCDPTGNLIHVDRMQPQGATFAANAMLDGREFVASIDNWFRPVFLAQGPDGAIYVCDMYRKTIEHPDYLPVEVRKHTDFTSGRHLGRLWRIVRADADSAQLAALRRIDLSHKSTAALCAMLGNDNGWTRSTAHRILAQRNDPQAVALLTDIVSNPAASPVSVSLGLQLLDDQGAAADELIVTTLSHESAGVRETALRLLERRVADRPELARCVAALADDADARVRFQAAVALGALPADDRNSDTEKIVVDALAAIAARDGADRWTRAAVFAALSGRELAFLDALRGRKRSEISWSHDLLRDLGRLLGASHAKERWPTLVVTALEPWPGDAFEDQAIFAAGVAESLRARGAESERVLESLIQADVHGVAMQRLHCLTADALSIARDASRPEISRRAAIGLLGQTDMATSGDTLLALVDPLQSPVLAAAAVDALVPMRDDNVPAALLNTERFDAYPPALRDRVLTGLLAQSHHVGGVLAELESGRLPPTTIDAFHRRQLTDHPDDHVRNRARKLFEAVVGDRAKVYDRLKDAVDLGADPARGRAVFRRVCANCHRLDREGYAVGPDLFGIRNQPKAVILLHILVPDQEITEGFAAYTVATKDGRILQGLVAGETPTSVTLRMQQGKEESILRSEIDVLAASKTSLMPQGIENDVNRQELADLLAYLKGEQFNTPSGENQP
jgi:putative membrane-bound dehydrogenase-like protein